MTTPVLADIHMIAESHVKVNDSCNCCIPWFGRKVVIMELPKSEPTSRRGSHSSYTVTRVTTENFRGSN